MSVSKTIFLIVSTVSLFALSLTAGTGAELYNEFMDSDEFYDDPEWQDYVDELGQKLLSYSDDAGEEYYFFVLDNPGLNAFATPDGYIYVNRGLIMYMNSEAQLAAVIGHEIGHVVARHGAKRRRASLLGSGLAIAAQALTGRYEAGQATHAAFQTYLSGYGRDQELEADRIGAEIIAAAGYNPLSVIDAVHVLKDQEMFARKVKGQPPSYHGLFDTHPQNDKRLHEAVQVALPKYSDTIVEPVRDFWEMIDGLNYGVEQNIGTRDGHIIYDKSLRLVIEFPVDWKVRLKQTRVVGQAPGGPSEAEITIDRLVIDQEISPEELVTDVLQRPDIKEVTSLEIDDSKSVYLAELEITDEDTTGALLAVHRHGYDYYVIRGDSGTKGSQKELRDAIRTVIKGIRNLSKDDLEHEQLLRIRVVVAQPGDTYAEFAKESPIRQHAEEMLRLINGHHPNAEPRAGDFVKIVK